MSSFKYIKFKPDGSREYYLAAAPEGTDNYGAILYRENGPALIMADGTEVYFTNGVKGRADDYSVINPKTGYKEWWTGGRLGCKEGPSIVYPDGGEDWLWQNIYHRADGPARIFADGTNQYFYQGKELQAKDDKEYKRKVKLINLY